MFVHPVSKMAPRQRVIHVSLKNLALVISEREQERAQLEQELKSMWCARLLDRPLVMKNEEMV